MSQYLEKLVYNDIVSLFDFKLTEKQEDFILNETTDINNGFDVIIKDRDAGVSSMFLVYALKKALVEGKYNILYVSPKRDGAKYFQKLFLESLQNIFRKHQIYSVQRVNTFDKCTIEYDDNTINVVTTDLNSFSEPNFLCGSKFDLIIVDEIYGYEKRLKDLNIYLHSISPNFKKCIIAVDKDNINWLDTSTKIRLRNIFFTLKNKVFKKVKN